MQEMSNINIEIIATPPHFRLDFDFFQESAMLEFAFEGKAFVVSVSELKSLLLKLEMAARNDEYNAIGQFHIAGEVSAISAIITEIMGVVDGEDDKGV